MHDRHAARSPVLWTHDAKAARSSGHGGAADGAGVRDGAIGAIGAEVLGAGLGHPVKQPPDVPLQLQVSKLTISSSQPPHKLEHSRTLEQMSCVRSRHVVAPVMLSR
jgi:hypothetical protein